MRVLIAGATGAVGRPLVRRLLARGHEVVGTSRSEAGAARVRELGAVGAVCDALDAAAVARVVAEHAPEVIVNELTALGAPLNPRRYEQWIAGTNRLRSTGTQYLVDAATANGVRRLVSQSIAFAYRWDGDGLKTEDDPLFDGGLGYEEAIDAMRRLESLTLETPGLEGVVLRYGWFYGPGTLYDHDGDFAEMARRRRSPIIGPGTGVFSFVHVDDAAAATVLAVERPVTGIFNVVDDDPAPQREWVPVFASLVGAPKPMRVPVWVARLAAAKFVVRSALEIRGASNARARTELGWSPAFPSWREGFVAELG